MDDLKEISETPCGIENKNIKYYLIPCGGEPILAAARDYLLLGEK